MEQDIVRASIRQIAKAAKEKGDFTTRDWASEPLPTYGEPLWLVHGAMPTPKSGTRPLPPGMRMQ